MDNEKDKAGVIAPPPAIYLIAVLIGLMTDYFFPFSFMPESFQLPIGLLIILPSVTLAALSFREFKKAETNVDPYKPSTAIITSGPFRYTRNPLYVTLSFVIIGVGIWLDNIWIIAMLVPVLILMHYGVIKKEEQYLTKKFGDKYLKYKETVPRWF